MVLGHDEDLFLKHNRHHHSPSRKGFSGSVMRNSCTDISQSKIHITLMLFNRTVNFVLSGADRKCISTCRPLEAVSEPTGGCKMLVNTLGLELTGSSAQSGKKWYNKNEDQKHLHLAKGQSCLYLQWYYLQRQNTSHIKTARF